MELPQALVPKLLAWYPSHARQLPWRQDKEPYHVWVSEIMLQQTRVEAVRGYYSRFLAALPTIEALANAPEEQLLKLWEGLGYYSRVRNLQRAAKIILSDFDGSFPRTYDAIRSLPGIGAYTAGAICSICFDLPTPAVDGNVLRVMGRVLAWDACISTDAAKRELTQAMSAIYPKNAGLFTQSLMELGATVCLPNGMPNCKDCPLQDICKCAEGLWTKYPIKAQKKPRTVEYRTVFVLQCQGKQAIRKRTKKGLLSGLWEYPNVSGTLTPEEALAKAHEWGACEPVMQVDRVHIFTHIEWRMRCYYLICKEQADAFVWATQEELEKKYSLPTAFRIFLYYLSSRTRSS